MAHVFGLARVLANVGKSHSRSTRNSSCSTLVRSPRRQRSFHTARSRSAHVGYVDRCVICGRPVLASAPQPRAGGIGYDVQTKERARQYTHVGRVLVLTLLVGVPGCLAMGAQRATSSEVQQDNRALRREAKALIAPHDELLRHLYIMSIWESAPRGAGPDDMKHLARYARSLGELSQLAASCKTRLLPLAQNKPTLYRNPWRWAYFACQLVKQPKRLMTKYALDLWHTQSNKRVKELQALVDELRTGKPVYEVTLRQALGWKLTHPARPAYDPSHIVAALKTLGIARPTTAQLDAATSDVKAALAFAQKQGRSHRQFPISAGLRRRVLKRHRGTAKTIRVGMAQRGWIVERHPTGSYKHRHKDALVVSRLPDHKVCVERRIRIGQPYVARVRWGDTRLSAVVGLRVVRCH